jgi:putative transcriptional regulator
MSTEGLPSSLTQLISLSMSDKRNEFFTSLVGQLLVAMPQMEDPRFERAIIYLCAHNADGAMGVVVNKLVDAITFDALLDQLGIEPLAPCNTIRVHFGGPVETGRGFVLHSSDYVQPNTLVVDERFALTSTIDVLKAIAEGRGPSRCLLALGYAGWGSGQLDTEMLENTWLSVPADDDLVFGSDISHKWENAIHKLGIDLLSLSSDAGHA